MWERLKYTERFTFVDMSKVELKSGLISISYLNVSSPSNIVKSSHPKSLGTWMKKFEGVPCCCRRPAENESVQRGRVVSELWWLSWNSKVANSWRKVFLLLLKSQKANSWRKIFLLLNAKKFYWQGMQSMCRRTSEWRRCNSFQVILKIEKRL